MRGFQKITVLIIFLLINLNGWSQFNIYNDLTIDQLVEDVLLGGGVTAVNNISFTGKFSGYPYIQQEDENMKLTTPY